MIRDDEAVRDYPPVRRRLCGPRGWLEDAWPTIDETLQADTSRVADMVGILGGIIGGRRLADYALGWQAVPDAAQPRGSRHVSRRRSSATPPPQIPKWHPPPDHRWRGPLDLYAGARLELRLQSGAWAPIVFDWYDTGSVHLHDEATGATFQVTTDQWVNFDLRWALDA